MGKSQLSTWAVAAFVAVSLTLLIKGPYAQSLINIVAIAALIAASMRFVMLIGELNFASAAFVGLGAYGAGIATTILGWPFALALILGPLVASVAAIAFGLVTLRIKGPYFMLIGFAFSEVVRIGFTKTASLGGSSGMIGIFPPGALDSWLPTFVVATVLVLLFALYLIEKSDFGKILVSLKDNENIAKTVGINVLFCKVVCFAIASFCAACAGSLQAFVNNVISPGDFNFILAAYALAGVKVGGENSIAGAVGGAILLTLLSSYALGLGAGEHFFYGGAIVLAILLLPNGLTGLAETLFGKWRDGKVKSSIKAVSGKN